MSTIVEKFGNGVSGMVREKPGTAGKLLTAGYRAKTVSAEAFSG